MDRNQDGYVKGEGSIGGSGKIVRETVGVYSHGPDGKPGTDDDITTFDWVSD
jgi:hypothetical protein